MADLNAASIAAASLGGVGELPEAGRAEFQRRAEAILVFLEQGRTEYGMSEALTRAWEVFVGDEPDVDLRRLSEVIVDSRRQALLQDRLNEDREKLHHGHLRHHELEAVGHHYETLRYQACVYNHLIRGLIERYPDDISRRDLDVWLTSASLGRHEWAAGEITGAVSEVALHAALSGMPELSGVRHTTVEEDLQGFDFVAEWQGQLLTLDAKTGPYRPLTERKHGHRHLEISVPHSAVDGLRPTRQGLDVLRREVRSALHAGYNTSTHGPHRWHHQPHGNR